MESKTQINENGRVVIPARLRKALDIRPGDEIVLKLEGDSIRLIPLKQAVRIAQNTVRQYVPEGVSLVNDSSEAGQ